MSKHYTAFQYNAAYKPTALRNWEVPKFVCDRPRQRSGRTQIIANNTGNLLPGVHRSEESPWGTYLGTWSMPRRIDRKTAATLNGSVYHKIKAHKCFLHYTAKPSSIQVHEKEPKEEPKTKTESEMENKEVDQVTARIEDQEEPIVKEEVPLKPLCPIHDIIFEL